MRKLLKIKIGSKQDKTGVAHSIIYHESEIEMPETKCIEMNHNAPNQSLTYDSTEMYNQPMEHHYNRLRRETDEDGYEEDQENTCILRHGFLHFKAQFSIK